MYTQTHTLSLSLSQTAGTAVISRRGDAVTAQEGGLGQVGGTTRGHAERGSHQTTGINVKLLRVHVHVCQGFMQQ